MRSFQTVLALLMALVGLAVAQYGQPPAGEPQTTSVLTKTVTRTVHYVVTETATGTPPASTVYPSSGTSIPYPSGNGTTIYPTGTAAPTAGPPSSEPTFDAAPGLSVPHGLVAAVLAGMGLLAL